MITQQTPLLAGDELRVLADSVLELSRADQTEVVLVGSDGRLSRFAQNQIHQNVAARDLEIRVRVVFGQRVGVATTNDASAEALARVVERACAVARVQPPNPLFNGLPSARAVTPAPSAFVPRTAECTPAELAETVAEICRAADSAGLNASGAYEAGVHALAVANSLGLFAHHAGTRAALHTVMMSADSSGYAARLAMDLDAIDGAAVGREAMDKASRGREPADVEPGSWTVILEEYAVADLLAYLGYVGFGAMAHQQGASFSSDRLGQTVCGANVSIWDDGLDAEGLLSPFDYEGVPRRRVDLIASGVATGVVYDAFTAGREDRESTGHALPAPNPWGPFPANLVMAPGTHTKEELLQGVDRGLWITRFHYVNVMDPKATVITGMTRDGTFLIEGGRLVRPVKNLRFTEAILGALSRVSGMTAQTCLLPAWFGAVRCPALRVDGFTFSGKTDF